MGAEPCGDILYFDYGCIAFWGLTEKQEQDVLRNMVVPCEENPLPVGEVEIDEFQFHYTASEKPHIQNVRAGGPSAWASAIWMNPRCHVPFNVAPPRHASCESCVLV